MNLDKAKKQLSKLTNDQKRVMLDWVDSRHKAIYAKQRNAVDLARDLIAEIKAREKLWCNAIIATQKPTGKPPRLTCDVEELLHWVNSYKKEE